MMSSIVSLLYSEIKFLLFPLVSSIINLLDPVSVRPDFLDISRSFLLKAFTPLDFTSNVSGSFYFAELKILIPVPDV